MRRLQTDHLDLYQIHRPDPDTDVEETLSALTDLVRSGKVRAIGTSTFPASEIVEAQWVAERRGLERFRTEQPPYSILNRSIEREVLPVCQRYGMGTLVWSPLGQGLLTGRIRKGQQTETHRSAACRCTSTTTQARRGRAARPARREGRAPDDPPGDGLRVAHPGVTSAIIGPRTMDQLDDLLAGADVTLDDEILDRIDEIVPPGTDAGPNEVAYTAAATVACVSPAIPERLTADDTREASFGPFALITSIPGPVLPRSIKNSMMLLA